MKLKFDIVASKSQHQSAAATFLRKALERHNIPYSCLNSIHQARADYVACWGWRNGRQQRERGANILLMERGYVGDRFTWTSYGWNGLNGRAVFPDINDGGRRWRTHYENFIEPRRDVASEYVLLIGQVEGDAAITGVNIAKWYADTAAAISKLTDLPIMFRNHPQMNAWKVNKPVPGTVFMPDMPLSQALARAAWVVTYNSNTGVEALLNGNAVVACDQGAMIWPVIPTRSLESIPAHPGNDELKQWAYKMAWKQWNPNTEDPGKMWEAVRTCLNGMEKAA